ncbi:hypothetical protein [Georgenia sp. MJ170]|uniref:hypothetical protein n=1 Tax=Georgenia sunbinii TaxID=3117728 RepID=UPI002F25F9AD
MTPGRGRRRPRRALAAVMLCVLAVLGTTAGAVATPEKPTSPALVTPATDDGSDAPSPSTAPSNVPKNVAAWFVGPGTEAARAESRDLGATADDVAVGVPHPFDRWAPEFIDGSQTDGASEPSGEWVAPIMRQGEDGPEAVGALRAGPFDSGEPESSVVVADPELGAALVPSDLPLTLVHDPSIDGWFAAAEGQIWPLTASGRELLHGPVPLAVFQTFLAERSGTLTPTPIAEDEPDDGSGLVPLTVIAVIVLLGLVGAWLLVRGYRRTDSRIEADVRAGLTPPEGVPRLDMLDADVDAGGDAAADAGADAVPGGPDGATGLTDADGEPGRPAGLDGGPGGTPPPGR